jgi:hypothetical protein
MPGPNDRKQEHPVLDDDDERPMLDDDEDDADDPVNLGDDWRWESEQE